MDLEAQTMMNLKLLLNDYKTKKMNISSFYKCIAILNEDFIFQNRIKTRVVGNNLGMATSPKTLEIKINPENNKSTIEKATRELIKYQSREGQIQVFNMFFIYGLLHEVRHFQQIEMALNIIPTPECIKEAHRIWYEFVIAPMSVQKERIYELYKKYHHFLFFERDANIASLKIVEKLFDDILLTNYCRRNLVNHYKVGYILKGPFVKSPVEYTCNLLGCNFDCTTIGELPFIERLEVGFPLKDDEYQQFLTTFYTRFESNEEIIERIRKIA